MASFDFLPKVNKCCFCIKNLKCACLIIIIIGVILSIDMALSLCFPFCREQFTVDSPTNIPCNILRWILFGSEIALVASLLAFLFGLFMSIRLTAIIVIWCALIKCLISILYIVVIMIHLQHTNCKWLEAGIITLVVKIIFWIYFIIVINSHADSM